MSELANNAGSVEHTVPEVTGGTQAAGNPGSPPPKVQKSVSSNPAPLAQAQVEKVMDTMRINVDKVVEQSWLFGSLAQETSELDKRRADGLQEGASHFQEQAAKLICVAMVTVIIVVVIIVSLLCNYCTD